MSDYKNTLNLPQTAFPMKANLAQREPQMLSKWQEMNLYQRIREQRQGQPRFVLHDGPPYANGILHVGHAINKVLKDIVIKSKTLSGFDSPYVPGWDCHGLPIEINVEKKVGKVGAKVNAKEFRQACRDYATKQIDQQRNDFMRLGVLGDWFNPYLTMNYRYEANIIRSLAKIIKNGHLMKGYKPVHWCTACGSALAEAEVEYKDKQSASIDVRFDILDVPALWASCKHTPDAHEPAQVSAVIWTTTPWTLPANQAVAVNPTLDYVIAHCEKDGHAEYLLLADSLLKDVMARYGIENYHVMAYCHGNKLEGLKLQHPFHERQVPIVLGEHVTTETGTGLVHTAPAHGVDDYHLAARYDLPVTHHVLGNGCFDEKTQFFAGKHVLKVDTDVIELLKTKGVLRHVETLQHSYPHCWRHKTPLIFRATPQWFISMDKQGLREQALATVNDVKWTPVWGQNRIEAMVSQRPDWCISRQREWGVPIPLFVHKKTGELHPQTEVLLEKVASETEKQGIECWFDMPADQWIGQEAHAYEKVMDILDVWFDSGVSHTCVLKQREIGPPAALYLEGSDQHRGWFQSALLTSIAMTGKAPFQGVLTHGFLVDSKGHKMSKSLGNIVEIDKAAKTIGVDILRLWVAASDYRGEVAWSDEIIKRNADTYRRIRNTTRFLLANLNGFEPNQHQVKAHDMLALDRWAVDRARLIQDEIRAAYDEYQYHIVVQKLHHFCSIDMGSFYLDIIKDRQYTTQADSLARRSAQTAMYHIIQAMVRWLAPVLSFTADEIWQYMPGEHEDSVFLATWYDDLPAIAEGERMGQEYWQTLMQVRDAVNKEIEQQRAAGALGSGLEAEVILYCNDSLADKLAVLGDELRFVLITSSAQLDTAQASTAAVVTEVDGLSVKVTPSNNAKCERCWHRRADIGTVAEHPTICARCVENVAGQGEQRRFA